MSFLCVMKKMKVYKNREIIVEKSILEDLITLFEGSEKIYLNGELIKIQYCLYFIYLIESLSSRRKESLSNNIRLNSVLLAKGIISNFTRYKKFLIKNEFIQITGGYNVENGESFAFSISDKYLNVFNGYQKFRIKDITLLKKMNYNNSSLSEHQYNYLKEAKRIRPHLVKNFNHKLRIDLENAYEEIRDYPINKRRANSYTIYEYSRQNWSYKIPLKTDKRLHTILTRTNKKLLKYITYDNQKLAEVDIKTSQPFFLLCFLDVVYSDQKENEIKSFVSKFFSVEQLNELVQIRPNIEELNRFKEIVLNKDFYSEISQNLELKKVDGKYLRIRRTDDKKIIIDKYVTPRDLTKDLILEALYSKVRNPNSEVVYLRKKFPFIFSVINKIKSFDTHILFSKFLQNLEAYILLDVIAKKIKEEDPNLVLFSKHDSLITTENKVDFLHSKVQEHFFLINGFYNKVTIEYW